MTAAPAAPAPGGAAARRPCGVAPRVLRLEELLADPRDASNRYGFHALAGAGEQGIRERAGELLGAVGAEFVPAEQGGHFVAADLLVRALRPLLGRDAALGHACTATALLAAAGGGAPGPVPAFELAPLLVPASLTAAAGTALRAAVHAVAEREAHEPALGRWRPPLAAAFADLLACESLTTVALRSLRLPPDSGRALRAAAGHAVPAVIGDVLDEARLALAECGYGAGDTEVRLCAKVQDDVPYVLGRTDAAAVCQAGLIRELPFLADGFGPGTEAAARALFRLEDPPDADGPGDAGDPGRFGPAGCEAALRGVLAATAARAGEHAGAGSAGGLARTARRLLTEQRLLSTPSRAAAFAEDPAAARALADRHALLLLACAVLGIRDGAAGGGGRFLARPSWALLALSRITQRLGVVPAVAVHDPHADVAAEMDARRRQGIAYDLHSTRTPW
ncbi:hypothetical protein AB0D57_45825 [Streptomyces sp. NPDC048275]|uniref:hypothetical protein n=1 Tax=Streptomyces sp. NPDC048275 TaxID=3155629 RepID=UPI003408D1AC